MIRSVDHINIATEKLADTRDFFVDVLGFSDGLRPDSDVPGHWLYAGGRPIVHLRLANGPVAPSRGSALDHAAFAVSDLEALAKRLDKHRVEYHRIDMAGSPVRQLFLHDPNGVMLEFNAPRAD